MSQRPLIERVVLAAVAFRGPLVLGTGLFLVVFAGLAQYLRLDALPDVTSNQVLVLTRAPGLTPEEVERLVTRPIEAALGGLPGLIEQRSLSRYGISSITTVFDDDVPAYLARQVVKERLDTTTGQLPAGVDAPELGPLTGGLGEIFQFTLRSDRRTPTELQELATFKVAPLLRGVAGVVEVNLWGGDRRTFEVHGDPVKMAQRGMPLSVLRDAIQDATGTAPGASVPAGGRQVLLRGVSLPRSPSELGDAIVPLAAEGGEALPLRVSDVAQIAEGTLPRIGAATSCGRGETIYLMVQMLRGENALQVMERVHEKMEVVRRVLPEDTQIEVVYDRSTLVLHTLRTVGLNLLEGGFLVVLVLLLMLGSLRAGLLVALSIPLSMLGAVAGMVLLGIPGNLMSLGAIDFGLIVDGGVVMVENLFHHLPEAEDESPTQIGSICAAVARPVFFSVLIILLVYLPVLSLGGIEGKMFRPMALTVVFAMLTSLLLSITFIPAASAMMLRKRHIPSRPPLLVRLIDRAYAPLLRLCMRVPKVLAVLSALLLLLGVLLYLRSGSEFVPQLDEGDIVIQTTRAADISLEQAVREASRMEEAVLARVPEVTQVVSRIGSPSVATDIMGIEQADVFLAVKPMSTWKRGGSFGREDLLREIEKAIDLYAPSSNPSFTQPIEMRFNELLAGAVTDVTLNIYGDDLDELARLAAKMAEKIALQPGSADVRVLSPPSISLIEVRPRPLDAAQAGFTVAEVLDAVRAVRTGIPVGATYLGPLRVPIMLRLLGLGQTDAFTLSQLPLPTRSGGAIPLSRVADVETKTAPSLVNHHNAERRLLVGFNVRGADLGQVVEGAKRRTAEVSMPSGYRKEWGGQYQSLQEATRRLLLVIPAVLVLILGVLYVAFGRLRPALIIYSHVPFASVGGMMALGLRGLPLSISAAIGFIALSGVAVLNGVVLITQVLRLQDKGRSFRDAAEEAARQRARPVLMTALVAALGFVPMMLARGVGAEVQRPLATVVVGGLVTSTILTLLILPAVYPWLAGKRQPPAPAQNPA